MEAAQARVRFSTAVHVYLWLFCFSLAFVPAFITKAVSDRLPVPTAYWTAALIWPIAIAILFLYARRQCSSDTISFQDGLLWVTSSMMTGWMYQSFFTVFAALAGTYCAAVFVALAGDVRRDPTYAPERWKLIVRFFHSHRMRR